MRNVEKPRVTIKSLTETQIRKLRADADDAGDHDMAAVCTLALDGWTNADDYTTLSRAMDRRIRSMTQEQAYEIIVDAINDAVK